MFSQSLRRRVLRRVGVPAAAVALALGLGVVVTTTPAAASGSFTGRAYIYGEGSLIGDLDDEGVVNVATHRSSNVTCLWQTILWADGYLPASAIDGVFGDQTHAATVRWQRGRGLTGDGSVGRQTFAKAGQKLRDDGPSNDGHRYGIYDGSRHYLGIRRPTTRGNWMFDTPHDYNIPAAYNRKTC
ncbi:peptidoglycan-binding protein [Kribbella sp. NPDC056345]|uniref:peptidoglycan-binding domain-containing protein n=1 Tax=Kribbella sp. NPDC056345 TaxID=3345789 RepID=UPI0035D6940A